MAQDRDTTPELEELIPDSAIDGTDAWAETQDTPDGAAEEVLDLDPDSPLDDMPDMAVEWPDDIELPPIEQLAPEADVEFAELETDAELAREEMVLEQVDDQITIAFPTDVNRFPLRTEFLDRYESLSAIEELGSEDNIAQLAARARSDEELLGELLRAYGYYDGQVIRTIGGIQPGEDSASTLPRVRFDIVPGARYRFGAIDLGDLASAPDALALREAFEIRTGDPLDNFRIVAEQFDLDRALGETGYPFAAIDAPELLVDHARSEGDLTMPVRPGGKYAFGEVTSNLPDFLSARHLSRIARFDPGDTYQRSLEDDLRRAIVATGLVSTVTVKAREVTPPSGDQPGTVAMDVEMTPARLRTIAGAIGYGSGEGFRVEASWEHRNLFPPEGLLRFRGIAGTREQLLGVTFRKNNFTGRDKVLTVDAFATTIDTDAVDARTVSVIGTFERLSTLLFQKPFSWSVGLETVATEERPAPVGGVVLPRQRYFVAALPLFAQIDTSNDLLDPTKGFRLGGRLSPEASRTQGAESFYLRSQVDATYYQQFSERVVMAGRARFGSIPGADLADIAPSRRFYAGGGGSVRGYGFQAIGPRDALGLPTGGRSLVEFALEARIKTGFLDGAVSVVPFVDAGSVGTDATPDFETIKIGAGVGVRYATGFGPLRLDVATPINPGPGDSRIAVYVSLGQAF
jgi:translocation and assembly module TamA